MTFRISVLWQAPDHAGDALERGVMVAVPPPFMAGDAHLFADGFELGNAFAWDVTLP